eukprot:6418600-Pyramimonas_sp.AAC.1
MDYSPDDGPDGPPADGRPPDHSACTWATSSPAPSPAPVELCRGRNPQTGETSFGPAQSIRHRP